MMPELIYHCTKDGFVDVEEFRPVKLIEEIPKWFKDMPMEAMDGVVPTARRCPSFVDLFKSAYVMKAWEDMEFFFFPEEKRWEYSGATSEFDISQEHDNMQLLDHIPYKGYERIIKPASPWMLETPKGYSVYQLPYPFDFQQDFDVWPGITHTDFYHETNVQLFVRKKSDDPFSFKIRRGQPLCLHVPFRREEEPWTAKYTNDGERYMKKSFMISLTKFKNGYRSLTKGWIK